MKKIKNLFLLIQNEFHKKTYFKQVLLSYILISCITFLVFSITLLTLMQRQHHLEMESMNKQNIEQAYSFNNSVIQDISTYCYNALDSVDVRQLLYSDSYDTLTAINSRETYNNFQAISSMILTVDFINYKTDTVLTKTGRYSLSNFIDQELLTLLETLTPSQTPYFCYPREIPYSNGNHSESHRVISLIYYLYSNGALVVNIDYNTYCSMLNMDYDSNFDMILLNSNNQIIASTNDNQFMDNCDSSPLYQQIQANDSTQGTFLYEDETGKYNVAYRKATPMGITYISMYSRNDELHGSDIYSVTLQYSIVYLAVTLLLSFLASYIIYNPIKKLKKNLYLSHEDTHSIEQTHKNEFEYMESVYHQLLEKNSTLSRFKHNYAEGKQQSMLWKLMNDMGTSSISQQDMEALDSSFEYLNYLVFIINIEPLDSLQDIEKDLQLYKFAIKNVTNEIFESQTSLKYVETVSTRLIFTGSFEHYNKRQLQEKALQIQQFFNSMGLFHLSFGFGLPVQELESLSSTFDTAKTALINGRLLTSECIQFYDDLNLVDPTLQHYPYEADQSILSALKTQNSEACSCAIDDFFDCITNYHYNQIHRSIMQLDAALQRFEYTNNLSHPSFELEWDNQSLPSLTEMKSIFLMRCDLNIHAMIEIKTHSSAKTELISEVNAYIEEHIYDPNLSVTMIAEKVDLSINYLRNIYKENTGESLNTYIVNKKLTIVCDLLANTDIPIQDISNKLGFTTKNYFFTFFKKHMNMTPTQYRSINNKHN